LLDADDGVIDALNPIETSVVLVELVEVVNVVLTTCNTLPADACNADDDPAVTGYVIPADPSIVTAMI